VAPGIKKAIIEVLRSVEIISDEIVATCKKFRVD